MCVLTVYIYALDDVLHFPSNSTKEKRQRDGIVFFFVLAFLCCMLFSVSWSSIPLHFSAPMRIFYETFSVRLER